MPRSLLLALGLNLIWINASEVFRYFAFVMPMMRDALPQVADVAPMNFGVFAIWGVWDTILLCAATGFSWLYLMRVDGSPRGVLVAGTALWAGIFGILWLGLWNMNLATPAILGVALPLAWVEMVVAAALTRWAILRPTLA